MKKHFTAAALMVLSNVIGASDAGKSGLPEGMYVRMGLFGLENLATEELAARGVYQFLFVLTHGKTRGSTAAVVAPAAVY